MPSKLSMGRVRSYPVRLRGVVRFLTVLILAFGMLHGCIVRSMPTDLPESRQEKTSPSTSPGTMLDDWIIVGKVDDTYGTQFRLATVSTDENDYGADTLFLLLDYPEDGQKVPFINIGLRYPEGTALSQKLVGGFHVFTIVIDGRSGSRIKFLREPLSTEKGINLVYGECVRIHDIYYNMRRGKQIKFVADDGKSIQFSLQGLKAVTDRLGWGDSQPQHEEFYKSLRPRL